MKASVICTLKNEEASVKDLIDSLLFQSRKPDEIIIVDGGSKDNTVEIINSYIIRGAPITLIIEKNANISRGRNIAIKKSKYDYIAGIDGGCKADRFWLQNLLKPFEEDPTIDVVSGFYFPAPESIFEDVAGELLYPKLERIKPENFLPDSNSVAFKKKCWEEIGGYPEWLYTGEDGLFDIMLKERGFKFAFAKDAVVLWRPRDSVSKLFKQYFLYTKGAKEANTLRIMTLEVYGENVFVYILPHTLRYFVSLLEKGKIIHVLYIPIILLTVFLAKICGLIAGKNLNRYKAE